MQDGENGDSHSDHWPESVVDLWSVRLPHLRMSSSSMLHDPHTVQYGFQVEESSTEGTAEGTWIEQLNLEPLEWSKSDELSSEMNGEGNCERNNATDTYTCRGGSRGEGGVTGVATPPNQLSVDNYIRLWYCAITTLALYTAL